MEQAHSETHTHARTHNLHPAGAPHPLQESCLLTQMSDVCPVIVRQRLVAQNGISHLRSSHEVHLQELGLEGALSGVVLQDIQQEGRALLYHVQLHKHIHNLPGGERGEGGGGGGCRLDQADGTAARVTQSFCACLLRRCSADKTFGRI